MGGRVLGVDVGERRVGLAISDASRTLARPLSTIDVTGAANAVERVMKAIDALVADEDGLETIVIGLPARLDGSATGATPRVLAFVDALRLFKVGYSWGGVTSLVMTYDLQSPKRPAYGSRLVRLYTGLESVEDLIADVEQALASIG